MRRLLLPILLLAALPAMPVSATVLLLAKGTLDGSSAGANADLSGLTGTLENGVAANVLGGIGSGLAYAGGNTFLATPDRGPNATTYNTAVDNTVSYISRFQTIDMGLTASAAGSPLPFALTPTLTKTTLLSSPTALIYGSGANVGLGSGAPAQNTPLNNYFSGRSDNYGPGNSGNPLDARLDPEAIRVSNDGATVFVSDEYGPYVRQFDRATGSLVRTYTLPANLDVANLSPVGDSEISGNTSGRTANKGMEGLAITPDGKTLVGIMQAALIQDATGAGTNSASKNMVRIVKIDIATGTTQEFGYALGSGASGVSEIVAINDHEFLIDERDGKGLGDGTNAAVKRIVRVDLTGATDITALSGSAAASQTLVKKNGTFLDLVAALTASGITPDQIPAKIEGISFGQDVMSNGSLLHTLYIANDNDFLPTVAAGPNPNQFFVFGFQDGDLPGFTPQALAAVPEPSTWATFIAGFGLIGGLLRRRRPAGVAA